MPPEDKTHAPWMEGSPRRASRSIIRIVTTEDDPTVRFAAEELERCLGRMTGGTAVRVRAAESSPAADTLRLGTAEALGVDDLPALANPALDDAIGIRVEERRGTIAGANPRAVLIAVYRYLTELGCRWVRPGPDGEVIPRLDDPLGRDITVAEAPAYRHRGLAIEGACSCEHVTDLIDWMPKVGMNSYFIEYFAGYIFYNNWYSERHKAGNAGKLMSEERVNELAERAIEEIKRRGMLFHRAGHGWTCLPLGITPDLWDETLDRDFGEMTQYIALYNGERKLYHGIPRRTNLCYSSPEARRLVVEEIVTYATDHPEVDYLHVWLADGSNHFCECDRCRRTRPADLYVRMLNELDAALSDGEVPTRIVFLVYADLLWAPEEERVANPDRFVLMFAPIHRSFYDPLDAQGMAEPVPDFVLNELTFPRDANLNHLAAWQKVFAGDSFVFDYRFWTAQYGDPGQMALARIALEDAPALGDIGLNGMVSDQTQRVFWPSALAMTVLARGLWNPHVDFDALADDFFDTAFGPDGRACRAYLERITECFSPKQLFTYVTDDPGSQPPEVIDRLRRVPDLIEDFSPVVEKNRGLSYGVQARSWQYLSFHAQVCTLLARAMVAQLTSGAEQAEAHWRALEKVVVETESETNPVFDVFLFLRTMRFKYRIPEFTAIEDL